MRGSRIGRGLRTASVAAAALTAGMVGAWGLSGTSAASSAPSVITGGQTIASGQELESGDGHYALVMETDGNLEEVEPSSAPANVDWQSGTAGNPGAQAVLETDGTLAVETTAGTLVWSNDVTTPGCPALNIQDDGNVVDYGPSAGAWATGTISSLNDGDLLEPGQVIDSPSHNFQLVMDTDGNLVLLDNEGNALWETYTNTDPGAYASLGSDGNLAVIDNGSEVWSISNGQPGDYLTVQDDGNMVLYPAGDNASTGGALWSTDSAGAAVEGGNLFDSPQFGSSGPCPAAPAPAAPPAPTVTVTTPTSTVVTVAPTAPKPGTTTHKAVDVAFKFRWIWRGSDSYLRKITFGKVPPDVHWTATITPAKHGAKVDRFSAPTAARRHRLLLWLEHRSYTTGERVKLDLTCTDCTAETVTFKVRFHKLPFTTVTPKIPKKKAVTKPKTTAKKP